MTYLSIKISLLSLLMVVPDEYQIIPKQQVSMYFNINVGEARENEKHAVSLKRIEICKAVFVLQIFSNTLSTLFFF